MDQTQNGGKMQKDSSVSVLTVQGFAAWWEIMVEKTSL